MTTPGDPTHRHDELHRGPIPLDQIADGAAGDTYVPISNGDGTATWGPQSGGSGGSSCDHQHARDRFVAAGDTPETFTLSAAPIDGLVDVRVDGVSADPDDITVSGSDVSLDTTAGQIVVVYYAKVCTSGSLAFPGTELPGSPSYSNVMATIVAPGPGFVTVTISAAGGYSSGMDIDLVDSAGATARSRFGTDGFDMSSGAMVPGTIYFPIPAAGTWYLVVGTYGQPYDTLINDGAGTYAVTYPTGTPTGTPTFPGSNGGGPVGLQNDLGSFSAGPAVAFVTLDAPLASGYGYYGLAKAGTDVSYPNARWIDNPDATSGLFVLFLHTAETWTQFAYSTGTYDSGLTGSGSYEVIAL